MSDTILYTFRRCPYAIRARMALFAAGRSFEIREVVLKDKPPQLLKASPKGTVPVLVCPDKIIEESLEIMHWAIDGTNIGWLHFTDNMQQEIHKLITHNDGEFKFNLDRYKYPQRYDIEDEKPYFAKCCAFLETLNTKLKQNRFLFAQRISLADIAIFPFVRQFSKVDIKAFGALPYSELQQWLKYHEESELFKSVMTKYPQWHEGDAPLVHKGSDNP
ncbi:glutathione S-transferase [Candidatus Uabimicrobium amorphum]|uniref:Glutathione S-transferase n=1 Tax=Uabimicrobium amorphum TaxID=2596890 RepID=A0A5S9IUJ1_UABAM|nr:glutathione S-transferase [Candidatus Uabimicrobium amorphum]BBM87790.1 glutathione S-transferase [Candidatus Uabimicrobium amorphum]